MPFRNTPVLNYPIGNFKNVSLSFGKPSSYDGKYWGMHLGVDLDIPESTKVFSAGRGVIVYSKLHPGEFSPDGKIAQRNWGGIIVIAHKNPIDKKFFILYTGTWGKGSSKKETGWNWGILLAPAAKR